MKYNVSAYDPLINANLAIKYGILKKIEKLEKFKFYTPLVNHKIFTKNIKNIKKKKQKSLYDPLNFYQ